MTPRQISLVQASFAPLAPQAEAVARAFYERLFQLDPSLRSMFPADLGAQRTKLMQVLSAAIHGLSDMPSLLPTLSALAERHVRYGARPQHYETVGAALLDTLRAGLGSAFDAEREQAWRAAYGALAGAMQAAASHSVQSPAA
jgi:nitric oxide dioxygenase